MKIFKKRSIAFLIDGFVFGAILVFCQELFNKYWGYLRNWDLLLIFLFFLRDFVFRNASLGKKILGLAVYDNNWQSPKLSVLVKRSFLTATVGYALTWKAKFVNGDFISIFDWEREKLGTRVIDKKVYRELESIAKNQNGEFAKNMTELYNQYLRGLYLK